MNNQTSLALLVLLTAVGTLTVASAYAQDLPPPCAGCEPQDPRETAKQLLLNDIPISVWTDKAQYDHNDIIKVKGQVANVALGFPVTITVVSPSNAIVEVDQINVTPEGDFETTISTAGQSWKYNGAYTINVNYGTNERSNSVQIEIIGQFGDGQLGDSGDGIECGADLPIDDQCVPFSIVGGMVTNAALNIDDKSIVIDIEAEEDGTLTLTPAKSVQDGIFLVFVDSEQWDDVEIVDNTVTVMFPAGAEQIEIFGTFLIPEFGTIAVMILVVAIISIIAVSSRSRLSIMPRY